MGDCVFFFLDFQLFYNEHIMFTTKEKHTIFKKHSTIRLQGGPSLMAGNGIKKLLGSLPLVFTLSVMAMGISSTQLGAP